MAELFEPYQLTDTIKLRNRIVMAPMTTWSAQADGQVSLDELDYYRHRSGGVAMVITAATYTIPNGMGFKNQFYSGDDLYIPSLKKLAQAIQIGGAKAVLQLYHGGRMSKSMYIGGNQIVGPSAVKAEREDAEVPRALSEPEIHNIIESFYAATRRAIEAGFDGVEIHGANTYLIQQFYSPHSNRRDDYWGGTREKRMRFPIGIISSVKRAVDDSGAKDFIIGYRFSPEEIEEPGITIEDTLEFVNVLSQLELTYLNISVENYAQSSKRNKEDKEPIGKKIINKIDGRVPLLGVGRIRNLEEANDALNFGYDLIQLGRTIVINPDWVRKVRSSQVPNKVLELNKMKELYIPDGLAEKIREYDGWFPVK